MAVMTLQELCTDFLISNCVPEDAVKLLDFAICISNDQLKKRALSFFDEDHSRHIVTVKSLRLVSMATIKVVMKKCKLLVPEDDLFQMLLEWSYPDFRKNVESGEPLVDLRTFWKTNGLYDLIWFELMTAYEFSNFNELGGIFTGKECFEIVQYLMDLKVRRPKCLGDAAWPRPNSSRNDRSIQCLTFKLSSDHEFRETYKATITLRSTCSLLLLGFESDLDDQLKVRFTLDNSQPKLVFKRFREGYKEYNPNPAKFLFNSELILPACQTCKLDFKFVSGPEYEQLTSKEGYEYHDGEEITCMSASFKRSVFKEQLDDGLHYISGRVRGFAPSSMKLIYQRYQF